MDGQHLLALKKPHKLVGIRGTHGVVVVKTQVPHAVRERNELVPVNAFPFLDDGLTVGDAIGQLDQPQQIVGVDRVVISGRTERDPRWGNSVGLPADPLCLSPLYLEKAKLFDGTNSLILYIAGNNAGEHAAQICGEQVT